MADLPTAASRPLDAQAVSRALRRLAAAPQPPWLHGEVARRMGERLALVRARPAQVIDWWGGLGHGAAVLQAAYPQARRVLVEPDEHWLERSRKEMQAPWWSRRRWGEAGGEALAESGPVPGDAQLVWSNMMLHAAADPPRLFARWESLLTVEGFVMFSCLGPGTLRQLRELYAVCGWMAPMAPFVDMHDLGDMLVAAGFADPVMDQETLTLRWESAESALTELRTLGCNAAPDRFGGLRTPRWRRRLLAQLDALRGPDGRIGLEFEISYGHAFKAAPKVRAGTPTSISLEDMRAMVRAPRPVSR